MNSNFDKLMKEISVFEKQTGFDKTPKKELVNRLKEEVKDYEKTEFKDIRENKLMDIIVLVIQLSIRENIYLDKAWIKWFKKSEKYLS